MKTIEATLLAHKALPDTTMTDLLLVGPLPDGSYRGFTLLDIDTPYNDGRALVTYKARTGMQMSALSSTSDLGVDNAEATSLMPVAGFDFEGVTQAQVDAGALDKTPFVVYRVNYLDLTSGRHEIIAGGTIGEQRSKFGMSTTLELRSLSQQMKQSIGEVDSLTCRAPFGSQPIGTGGGVVEARHPCGFDLTAEWVTVTVGAVGAESDRIFTDATLTQDDDWFAPGVFEWLSGANVGQKNEIEGFTAGTFTLQFPTVNPILLGDMGRSRRECTKRKSGHNSCQTFWGMTAWALHFRGEPAIPVADAGKLNTPGAAINAFGPTGTGEGTAVGGPVSAPVGSTTTPTSRTRGATVLSVSASLGDGVTDATSGINAVIASLPGDGGTVQIPAGTYLVDCNTSILPVSNMLLQLLPGAVLQGKYTANDHVYVVRIQGKTQVEVAGGTIRGFRDSWAPITGTTSEWGHAIACYGSSHVTVRDTTLTKNVGDGMSVGGYAGAGCTDVVVDNVTSTFNRRQGLSLVWVDGATITDSTFSDTGGTSPECGIDVEPESAEAAQNITIRNCHLTRCAKYGINILKRSTISATVANITVDGCTIDHNDSNGAVTSAGTDVTFTNNSITLNSATGLRCSGTNNLTVNGNTFKDNYTRNGIDSTETATTITGLSSPTTDPDLLIPTAGTGQSIGANTYYT